MLLLNGESLTKSFQTKQLFQNLHISIFLQNKIGLIGENGSGKTTLLKILSGIETLDSGTLSLRKGLKVGYLPQSVSFPDLTPFEVLRVALQKDLLRTDYEKETLIKQWLFKLKFTGQEKSAALLSGGWKKRLALAAELLLEPDILLLDEPTNHLDLETILWLETFLLQEVPTYLLVSHDRHFLQKTTNHIIEISPSYPKGSFSSEGTYTTFLTRKEDFLKGQLEQERSLASKARKETEWLKASPKARTTKATARVDQTYELLEELSSVKKRNTTKKTDLSFTASKRETRKLLVAKNLSKQMDGKTLFKNVDLLLSPGIRIGLMGPNGSGKTTLLRLLKGELTPDEGTIKTADELEIAYFDQHKAELPNTLSLKEALCPKGDFVEYLGQDIHINSWCKRFLFAPELLNLPLSKFSGGERARIAIAHLMLKKADILLLDEPTNDLDIPTLETLEESLLDFPGAVILITHDRFMLERVCTTFLALNPSSFTLFSTYKQWEDSCLALAPPLKPTSGKPSSKPSSFAKKEVELIERKITALEKEIKELTHKLEDVALAQDSVALNELCALIALNETKLEKLYLQWEELEEKKHKS